MTGLRPAALSLRGPDPRPSWSGAARPDAHLLRLGPPAPPGAAVIEPAPAPPAMAARTSIESAADLMLALLYAPGSARAVCEDVSDTTTLVKLLYLLVSEGGFGRLAGDLRFEARDFGPWSADVFDAVETLKGMGLVNAERMRASSLDELADDIEMAVEKEGEGPAPWIERQKTTYYLTRKGKRAAKTLYEGATRSERERIEFIKRRFNKVSLAILLQYVRQRCHGRASEPRIRRGAA